MTLYTTFIKAVKKQGSTHHCKYARLAVQRYEDDVKASKKKSFGYRFDTDKADRAIAFIKALKHTKGEYAGRQFQLLPYQAFIVSQIFGWVYKDSGLRRFTKAYIEIARKNGKTELAAAIGLYMMIADGEKGAEIYSAATKKDQAKICFSAAATMARSLKRDSKMIDKILDTHTNAISMVQYNSTFKPLSADSDTQDGLNPHMGIIDEYFAHPTDGMLKVLETGMGARLQPLMLIITTAGYNQQSPCYQFRGVCINYLEGVVRNDNTFCIIFTLDEEDIDDYLNPAVWVKANPGIGTAPYMKYMLIQANNARTEGAAAEIEFKTKNLNIWTQTASTWIPSEHVKACHSTLDEIPEGSSVLGALDLSYVYDITALSLYSIKDCIFQNWYFCPEDKVKDRRNSDKVVYAQFEKDNNIIFTPGNIIDYDYIRACISELAMKYFIKAIAYDQYNSSQLVVQLDQDGHNMIKYAQSFPSMSPPTKELERRVYAKDVSFIPNPVNDWMFSNVELRFNQEGQAKVHKGKDKSKNKIDGIVAMVMAYGLSMSEEYNDSVYNQRGMTVLSADDED